MTGASRRKDYDKHIHPDDFGQSGIDVPNELKKRNVPNCQTSGVYPGQDRWRTRHNNKQLRVIRKDRRNEQT